jgi:hypothetical protein
MAVAAEIQFIFVTPLLAIWQQVNARDSIISAELCEEFIGPFKIKI